MSKLTFPIIIIGLVAGQAISLTIGGARAPLIDIAMLVLAIAGFIHFWRHRQADFNKVRYLWPLSIFAGIAILSLLLALPALNASEAVGSGLYLARLLLYLSLPFVILLFADKSEHRTYARQLLYGFVILAVLGFIQLAILPDLSIWEHLGWDPHQNRLFTTFFDPNFAGFILGIGMTLALSLLLSDPKGSKIEYSVILALLTLAELLTFSRTGLLAAVLMVSIILWFKARKLLIVFALALVVMIAATPRLQSRLNGIWEVDDTVKHRIESWIGATAIIRARPLLGVGYNTLSATRYDYSLPGSTRLVFRAASGFDSSLLTIAATTGLLGLLAFLFAIYKCLVIAFKAVASSSPFPLLFISLTLTLLVASWFINAWLYPPILALWLVSMALTYQRIHDYRQ